MAFLVSTALAAGVVLSGPEVGLVSALLLLLGCLALLVLSVWATLAPSWRSPLELLGTSVVTAGGVLVQFGLVESALVLAPPLLFSSAAALRHRSWWWAGTALVLALLATWVLAR